MIRHKFVQISVLLIAVSAQVLVLPLIGKNFTSVNPLLAVMIVFAFKETRTESLIWGALLGGVTDLLLFQHIGYHGIAFTLLAYILGFVSHKMVIHGVIPITFVSLLSFLFVFSLTISLVALFQGGMDTSLLLPPFLLGMVTTPPLCLLLEYLYRKSERLIAGR